jgi:hypothetical protein
MTLLTFKILSFQQNCKPQSAVSRLLVTISITTTKSAFTFLRSWVTELYVVLLFCIPGSLFRLPKYLFYVCFLCLKYSFYVVIIRFMIVLLSVCFASYFGCSVFLYCFVYCFSLCISLFLFYLCIVYGPLARGENPTSVNKLVISHVFPLYGFTYVLRFSQWAAIISLHRINRLAS